MTTIRYQNAYKEVLEIIKSLPKKDFEKIPKEKIEYFEKNQNVNHEFKFEVSKPLENQNISRETNAIILNLFNDYFLDDEQKVKLKEILYNNEKKYEETLREKYDTNNIFKQNVNIENIQTDENILNSNNFPIEIQKDNVFTRIIRFLKNIFGSKK